MRSKYPLLMLLLLNAFALTFYFVILTHLHPIRGIPQTLFETSDSREYLGYSEWLRGVHDYCNPVRTFLYPLLILVSTILFGNYGLWIMQLLFWLISFNLLFLTILRLTQSKIMSSIAFCLGCTLISPIGFTAHALTETTVLFLLSILMYFLAIRQNELRKINTQLALLLILSLLSATKPVYQVVWYAALLFILLGSFGEFKNRKTLFMLLLAASPVITQKIIKLSTHNNLSSTEIASSNLKLYFYRKANHFNTYGTIQGFDAFPDSLHAAEIKAAEKISQSDALIFLIKHPKASFVTLVDNLQDNIGSGYPCANTPGNKELRKWSQNINNKIMFLHLIALLAWLYTLFKRGPRINSGFISGSGILLFYILLTSGLVFWSGDRLVVPATTLWLSCYFVIGWSLYRRFKRSKEQVPQ